MNIIGGWVTIKFQGRLFNIYNPEFRVVIMCYSEYMSFDLSPEENYKRYANNWIEISEYLWTIDALSERLPKYAGVFPREYYHHDAWKWDIGGNIVDASFDGTVVWGYAGDPLRALTISERIA